MIRQSRRVICRRRFLTIMAMGAVAFAWIIGTTSGAPTGKHHHARKPMHCRRTRRGHRHHRCIAARRRHRRASPSVTSGVPRTTSATPYTPAPLESPSATSTPPVQVECARNTPIPIHVEGQTAIVGYANDNGGPAPPRGQDDGCPRTSDGDTVLLENLSHEVLQEQALDPGEPFDFVVEPGEYYVLDGVCPAQQEGPMFSPLKVHVGQQVREDVGCNLP